MDSQINVLKNFQCLTAKILNMQCGVFNTLLMKRKVCSTVTHIAVII